MATSSIAPLFGPPKPRISFWDGSRYLGVAYGHPTNIERARATLMNAVRSSAAAHVRDRELNRLGRAGAQLTCGFVVRDLT